MNFIQLLFLVLGNVYSTLKNTLSFLPSLADNSSNVITLISALIASVLTLVGLTSIFVSINNQHKIQKCREILWDISTSSISETVKHLNLYYEIQTEGESFTKRIINIAIMTITFISILFLLVVLSCIKNFSMYEFLLSIFATITIIFIMIKFAIVLNDLKSITLISNLPTIEKLLDTDNQSSDILSLEIASQCVIMNSKVIKPRNELKFYIGLPLPFTNIDATTIIYGYSKSNDNDKPKIIKFNKTKILLSNVKQLSINDFYWYETSAVILTELSNFKDLSIYQEFNSKQGHFRIFYSLIQIEDILSNKATHRYNPTKIEQVRIDALKGSIGLSPNQYTQKLSKITLKHSLLIKITKLNNLLFKLKLIIKNIRKS